MNSDEFELFRKPPSGEKRDPHRELEQDRLPTIMLIDDDQALLHSLFTVLRSDYNVLREPNAKQAVANLDMSVSAVVLDVKMPEMNGFQTIEEIKYKFAQLPVIFHSAYQDLKDPMEVLNEHRPFAYIIKGGDSNHLYNTLRSAVEYYDQFRLNKKLVEQLSGMNRQLEERVKERTKQLEEANELLQRASITDPLTDLFNRRYLMDTLEKEITADSLPMSFMILDVDHFKSVNDEYGHARGDDVLRLVADCLREGVREGDVVARYGGEEFTVFLRSAGLEEALGIAEKIRGSLEARKFTRESDDLSVTASFGVTQVREGDTPDSLVQRADVAMYKAKNQGRNRVISAG